MRSFWKRTASSGGWVWMCAGMRAGVFAAVLALSGRNGGAERGRVVVTSGRRHCQSAVSMGAWGWRSLPSRAMPSARGGRGVAAERQRGQLAARRTARPPPRQPFRPSWRCFPPLVQSRLAQHDVPTGDDSGVQLSARSGRHPPPPTGCPPRRPISTYPASASPDRRRRGLDGRMAGRSVID